MLKNKLKLERFLKNKLIKVNFKLNQLNEELNKEIK